jgi:hypothetical protein
MSNTKEKHEEYKKYLGPTPEPPTILDDNEPHRCSECEDKDVCPGAYHDIKSFTECQFSG